jgi:hypothetical protein
MIRSRRLALRRSHIQHNGPGFWKFLIFDIDRPDAAFADEDAGVAVPNAVVVNPDNGHAHLVYALSAPVCTSPAARDAPVRYLAAIERGMIRRLRADPGYTGPLAKNAMSPRWRVRWEAPWPYELSQLDGYLTRSDKRPMPTAQAEVGVGRNVALFDSVRLRAYREVLAFKRRGLSRAAFEAYLADMASGLNAEFLASSAGPLPFSEVRSVARSIAKFCFGRFSDSTFADIQRHRAETRTRRHLSIIDAIKHDASA